MKIKYFKDTDTALLEFSDRQGAEDCGEVSENIYLDLDEDGNLVSMTIENAAESASLPEVAVEEVAGVLSCSVIPDVAPALARVNGACEACSENLHVEWLVTSQRASSRSVGRASV